MTLEFYAGVVVGVVIGNAITSLAIRRARRKLQRFSSAAHVVDLSPVIPRGRLRPGRGSEK